jgi:Cu/Ag efflux pump CusA
VSEAARPDAARPIRPIGSVGRNAAMALAVPLAVAAVVGLGDDVQAPFLLAVGGGLVVSLALTKLIASALLLVAGAVGRASEFAPALQGRLPQPCR